MALINRLIAEAKAGRTVVVRPHEVPKVAEHMRKLNHDRHTVEENADLLRAGKVRMLDAPVVVRGT